MLGPSSNDREHMDHNIGHALEMLWIPGGFALIFLPIALLFLTV
jgi:hypothetical protein